MHHAPFTSQFSHTCHSLVCSYPQMTHSTRICSAFVQVGGEVCRRPIVGHVAPLVAIHQGRLVHVSLQG